MSQEILWEPSSSSSSSLQALHEKRGNRLTPPLRQ
jgi:hypothetical protein